MSHDIHTPMNAITGITSLLEHDADFQQPVKSVGVQKYWLRYSNEWKVTGNKRIEKDG